MRTDGGSNEIKIRTGIIGYMAEGQVQLRGSTKLETKVTMAVSGKKAEASGFTSDFRRLESCVFLDRLGSQRILGQFLRAS